MILKSSSSFNRLKFLDPLVVIFAGSAVFLVAGFLYFLLPTTTHANTLYSDNSITKTLTFPTPNGNYVWATLDNSINGYATGGSGVGTSPASSVAYIRIPALNGGSTCPEWRFVTPNGNWYLWTGGGTATAGICLYSGASFSHVASTSGIGWNISSMIVADTDFTGSDTIDGNATIGHWQGPSNASVNLDTGHPAIQVCDSTGGSAACTGGFAPAATCSDGILNQDETAIDFGGICPETETVSANITTSTNWDRSHLYLISGNIEVTTGDTLTIEPGTIVKFDTATSSSLTVNGILVVEGDEGDEHSLGKIFFTSLKDDSLLGLDTNSDGNSTSPAGGDWGGIIVGSGGSVSFERVVVRYAGKTGTTEAQIYNNGGTLTVENSGIVYGTDYGIYSDSGTTTITSSELGFNDYGLYIDGGTVTFDFNPDGDPSVIHDNSSYGIYNNTVSIVNVEDNYWGDPTGPYHNSSNLSGLGNTVSDYVDFDPWTNDRHYISNENGPGYCSGFNDCTSVYGNELQWKNVSVSSYTTELSAALSTWDALGSVDVVQDNSTPELEFHQVDFDDIAWKGQWFPVESLPDYIDLNSYYLANNTRSQIQHTITHELGHAFGLGHSYTGNVMYPYQTPQTSLGPQDESDYYYLWP